MSAFRFERVDLRDVPWDELDALPDRMVCQRQSWLSFIAESQHATPVVAAIYDGADLVAWFSGAKVRRFGIPILGSPFRGWSSSYLGFNLVEPGIDRAELARALPAFAFGPLGCVHLELIDRHLDHVPEGTDWPFSNFNSWSLDLTGGSDAILAGMSKSCRANIRKAERHGVVVADEGPAGFADLYYSQITEVFAGQGRPVPFPRERVQLLLDHLRPEERMCLVARNEDGAPIGSGLFVGTERYGDLWGMASTLADRSSYPNEAVMWAAIDGWRARGAQSFEFGGGGRRFKAKFGGEPTLAAWMRVSRWSGVATARTYAGELHKKVRKAGGVRGLLPARS